MFKVSHWPQPKHALISQAAFLLWSFQIPMYQLIFRYIQRCPLQFLKSGILLNILQLSLQGIHLDHRDANSSVFKFLYEMVHQVRRERVQIRIKKELNLRNPDFH